MTILSKLQMREYVSKDKLYSFIQSGLARVEWNDKDKKKSYKGYVVRNYEGELGQMNYYLEHMDENGMYYVEYNIPAKLQGRHKIPNCLTSTRRVVRNYLLCDDYYDFDMVNSFASILYMLAMKHNFRDYKILQDFINNRTDWIEGLMKELKKDKDDVKEFIITVVYSKPDADEKDEKKKIKWNESKIYGGKLRKLKTIITSLTATLRNTNLYNIDADRDNLFGCWISNLVMSIEDDIVVGFLNYIIINYPLLVRNPYDDNDLIAVGIYELDGFKLLKINVDEFGGPNAVITVINEWLLSFGFNTPENQFIQFSNKSMDDKLTNIPLLQYPNQLSEAMVSEEIEFEEFEEINDDNISSMSSITSPKSITTQRTSDKIKELNCEFDKKTKQFICNNKEEVKGEVKND